MKTVGILWSSNSVTMTETLAYKLSWRGSEIVQSISSGTIWTNCFNCELVWLEQPDRFCWMLETVDGGSNRRPAQGSVRQREPSRTAPYRTAQSKAEQW